MPNPTPPLDPETLRRSWCRLEVAIEMPFFEKVDGWVIPLCSDSKTGFLTALPELPSGVAEGIEKYAQRKKFRLKPESRLALDIQNSCRIALVGLPKTSDLFRHLQTARAALKPLEDAKAQTIVVDLRGGHLDVAKTAGAFASALLAMSYPIPKYGKRSTTAVEKRAVFLVPSSQKTEVQASLSRAEHLTRATNLVRALAVLPSNELTPKRYLDWATQLSVARKLKTEFFSVEKLKVMGAGAFVAVAQGSDNSGQGILKISYQPSQKLLKTRAGNARARRIAFVGKGVTFDTGGTNLKTGPYLYGMNQDMTGSAVALSLILLASENNWPFQVTAYLALVENLLGPKSYRPNDVVTALNGKTIEVIDTDAEGRMILADTLSLASLEKPDVILDFATLTGSCIRALGTAYSGVYSNSRKLYRTASNAGRLEGERVWPFPNDNDYGKCLESEIADLKQCRLSGGADHIEAGYFLRQFVSPKIPWLHVDLSAAKNEDGLAHVPTKTTGFGPRFATAFLERLLGTRLA